MWNIGHYICIYFTFAGNNMWIIFDGGRNYCINKTWLIVCSEEHEQGISTADMSNISQWCWHVALGMNGSEAKWYFQSSEITSAPQNIRQTTEIRNMSPDLLLKENHIGPGLLLIPSNGFHLWFFFFFGLMNSVYMTRLCAANCI
jgi:hypothetical protein